MLFLMLLTIAGSIVSKTKAAESVLPRVIVMTDGETDDLCSMVHFLLYANDMQIDGIIQANSCFQRKGWSSEPWLEQQIAAYEKVYPNLKVHDAGYPTADYLRSRVYVGDENPEHVVLDGGTCKKLLPGTEPVIDPSTWADTPSTMVCAPMSIPHTGDGAAVSIR